MRYQERCAVTQAKTISSKASQCVGSFGVLGAERGLKKICGVQSCCKFESDSHRSPTAATHCLNCFTTRRSVNLRVAAFHSVLPGAGRGATWIPSPERAPRVCGPGCSNLLSGRGSIDEIHFDPNPGFRTDLKWKFRHNFDS